MLQDRRIYPIFRMKFKTNSILNSSHLSTYGLFFVNSIIFFIGIVVFSYCLSGLFKINYLKSLIGSELFTTTVYIFFISSLHICIISCLGCVSAIKNTKNLLWTYIIIVFITFIIMLFAMILINIYKIKMITNMKQDMFKSLGNYERYPIIKNSWNLIQKEFKCCGIDNWQNWLCFSTIPESCCSSTTLTAQLSIADEKQCIENPSNTTFIHRNGCYNEINKFIGYRIIIFAWILIIIIALFYLGIIFAYFLIFENKKLKNISLLSL